MSNLSQPPVLVGQRIFWLGSGSGLPKSGIIKWIGHLPEMGQHDWTVGIELDEALPYGGIDGAWGQRTLFRCKQKHGLIVPITQIAPASNLKLSKQLTGSSSQLLLKEKDSNDNQNKLPQAKKIINTNVFQGVQKQQQTGTNSNSIQQQVPLPAVRKKHQQQLLAFNKDRNHESNQNSVINKINLNHNVNELKYRNDQINKKSIIFDEGSETDNENFYDCYNKFDTLTVEEKANLLLNKCIESRGRKREVLEIINNGSDVQAKRMLSNHPIHNNSSINSNIIVQAHQSDSHLESITVSDTVFAARRQIFYKHGRSQSDESHTAVISSSISSSSSRREKGTSGIFSFFRWFKKDKETDDDVFEEDIGFPSAPSSPKFIRSQSSSCGSVDTLFSTATASSFAFIHPAYYRPFGSASQAETRIVEGPETFTYKKRVKERDQRRELEKDITLKKKYNLFGSNTLHRSADDVSGRHNRVNRSNESLKQIRNFSSGSRNSTLNRKKRKAPPPPILDKEQNDYSLPNTLEHLNKSNNNNNNQPSDTNNDQRHHRRTVSESAKDKKAGAYCHVRGKRKAPPPPTSSLTAENTNLNKTAVQSNHSLGKKKRPAPPPPINTAFSGTDIRKVDSINNLSPQTNSLELNKENVENDKEKNHGSLSPEEKERLLKSIAKLQVVANRRSSICSPPSSPNLEQKMAYSLCNDSLKLERGVLKSTKSEEGTSSTVEHKFSPPSPVSPRPWYKRNIMRDHGLNNGKLFDKKKEKVKVEDWMPEVGIPRATIVNTDNSNKFNIFSKSEKNEEKRKSQISMLVNISELDREAAEIVQKEHAKERSILAAEDEKFYLNDEVPYIEGKHDFQATPDIEIPKRSSARELISLFNAITNVTKVTVNTSFFSKEGSSLFSRDGKEKRFSFGTSTSSISTTNNTNDVAHATQEKYNITTQNIVTSDNKNYKKESVILETQETYLESPGETRRRWTKTDTANDNEDDNEVILLKDESSDNEGVGGARVTIEEIDEFDIDFERATKTQALYEANKLRRHHSPSPSIPTIVEMSESTSSVATSPGSTSTRSQKTTTPTTPTTSLLTSITPATPSEPPNTQQQTQMKRPTSIWACPQCTLENPRWRLTCEACDMWKPPLQHTNKQTTNTNLQINNVTNNLNEIENKNSKEKIIINSELQKNIDTIQPQDTEVEELTNNINTNNDIKIINENSMNILKEEKQKLLDDKNNDIEELRKARLAFFHKTKSIAKDQQNEEENGIEESQNEYNINTNNNNKNIEDEQTKLKEMLKDLKHSLPKRHKKNNGEVENIRNSVNTVDAVNSKEKGQQDYKEEIKPAVKNLGAIKKIPQSKLSKPNIGEKSQVEEKAEVYLVKTEKIIEDIKVRKQSNDGSKPEKVSASVQTSAMVRKTDIPVPQLNSNHVDQVAGKPPVGRIQSMSPSFDKKDITIPITVEEYTIKDGILYTSLSKEKKKIGTGTFELILPRDFAGIKTTKTAKDSVRPPLHHVYANVPNPDGGTDISSSSSSSSYNNNNISFEEKEISVNEIYANNEKVLEKLTEQLTQPKGLADFKAGLESEAATVNESGDSKDGTGYMMNTVAVNRLLRRLEAAISKGQLKLAAKLAKELAQLKINCSVTRQKTVEDIVVDMYIEDKVSHQGPIPIMVSQNYTVAQLKMKVEKEFEIPVPVQRWILGKQLAVDDAATLMDLGINTLHCPIFLYLVAPEMGQERVSVVLPPAVDQLAAASITAPEPPPPPENVKRGGWYYNDEEDKYSFCEDTESELSDDASRVGTPQSMVEEEELEDAISEYSENEIVEELDERPPTPPERHIGIEQAQAVNLPPAPTGTLALGWKCELCTLVNSPTRPGCAACTNPRPVSYHIPKDYQVSDHELERIQLEEHQQQETAAERLQNYQALVDLENADVVLNTEEFECPICFMVCAPRDGVILRDCLHTFCRTCVINTVQFNEEAEVKCPYRDTKYACDSALLEREIKALVPVEVFEQHLAKSVAQAENKIGNAFHCKTPDCPGWCIFEDNVNEFLCPVCNHTNCLTCQAIHPGINCKQFQERAKQDSETNADARRTNEMLEEMVDRGEAMKCPTCQVILMKKWGCDWLRCSMCKTEICWVTRGPRWGPQGKGDTSGGCQCGVNGIKCHPKCNYCH